MLQGWHREHTGYNYSATHTLGLGWWHHTGYKIHTCRRKERKRIFNPGYFEEDNKTITELKKKIQLPSFCDIKFLIIFALRTERGQKGFHVLIQGTDQLGRDKMKWIATSANSDECLLEKSYSPLALPAVFGNILQRRVKAVCVIADVTVITKQQTSRICGLATSLAYGTLQTTPTFT